MVSNLRLKKHIITGCRCVARMSTRGNLADLCTVAKVRDLDSGHYTTRHRVRVLRVVKVELRLGGTRSVSEPFLCSFNFMIHSLRGLTHLQPLLRTLKHRSSSVTGKTNHSDLSLSSVNSRYFHHPLRPLRGDTTLGPVPFGLHTSSPRPHTPRDPVIPFPKFGPCSVTSF